MMIRMTTSLSQAMKEQGNCFQIAYEVACSNRGWLVCHGIPVFQGAEHFGERYRHAWNESDNGVFVVDCSLYGKVNGFLRRDYYSAGQLNEQHVVRYTMEQALEEIIKHEHYGGWKDWPGVTL